MNPEFPSSATFDEDVAFVSQRTRVVVLGDAPGPRVAIAPLWQARVLTSTAGGDSTSSQGWIHYERVASDTVDPHINVFGGEDRLWLGPEGGQYSVFFAPGARFDLEHWHTPTCVDLQPYETVAESSREASYRALASVRNYTGTEFEIRLDRTVRLLDRATTGSCLGPEAAKRHDERPWVGFESHNTLTNRGRDAWSRARGLLSIWILGMFPPSPTTTVVIPVREGDGPIVNDQYFGPVPESRLAIEPDALFFRGDGQHRSKIGVSPARARSVLGAHDPARGVLTIVQFDLPDRPGDYVNSMWTIQDDPYAGDVVNSYNDGPPAPNAAPLGPFYELESSSPARALAPDESITHRHRTWHFVGTPDRLDPVAKACLGMGIDRIDRALTP